MIRSEINPNYPEAYYPHYDPSLHPLKISYKKYINRNKSKNIYTKDNQAYYGRINPYRVIDTTNQGGSPVKIKMGDLTEFYPSQENLEELQRQLDNINRFISLPKELLKEDKGKKVYLKDPNAYYDPTSTDLFARKAHLEKLILGIKKTLAKEKTEEISANDFDYQVAKGKVYVENKFNTEREKENEYIKDSFYYDVKKNNKNESKEINSRNSFGITDSNAQKVVYKTIARNYKVIEKLENTKNQKKAEETKKVPEKNNENKSEKPFENSKLQNEKKIEKIKPTENKKVEAELKADKRVEAEVKESLKKENVNSKEALKSDALKKEKIKVKEEKKIDIIKQENKNLSKKNKNQNTNQEKINSERKNQNTETKNDIKKPNERVPDSQGFKIEKVKILSSRKILN